MRYLRHLRIFLGAPLPCSALWSSTNCGNLFLLLPSNKTLQLALPPPPLFFANYAFKRQHMIFCRGNYLASKLAPPTFFVSSESLGGRHLLELIGGGPTFISLHAKCPIQSFTDLTGQKVISRANLPSTF